MLTILKQIEITPATNMYGLLSDKKYDVIFIEGDTYNYSFGVINENRKLVVINANDCFINIKTEGGNGSE